MALFKRNRTANRIVMNNPMRKQSTGFGTQPVPQPIVQPMQNDIMQKQQFAAQPIDYKAPLVTGNAAAGGMIGSVAPAMNVMPMVQRTDMVDNFAAKSAAMAGQPAAGFSTTYVPNQIEQPMVQTIDVNQQQQFAAQQQQKAAQGFGMAQQQPSGSMIGGVQPAAVAAKQFAAQQQQKAAQSAAQQPVAQPQAFGAQQPVAQPQAFGGTIGGGAAQQGFDAQQKAGQSMAQKVVAFGGAKDTSLSPINDQTDAIQKQQNGMMSKGFASQGGF